MDNGRWSKREQLYLMSAVSAAGDQDWNAVSRTMKQWLGGGKPPDCFSPKHCAAQHKALLQNAGRHPVGDTANEALLQRLISERMDELKAEILNNQLMYAEIHGKMVYAQSDDCSEEELSALLKEIEQHPAFDAQRIEELKRAERAEPKAEWRPTPVLTDNTTAVDMDVEEIVGTKQIIMPASAGQQTLGGTSPLLSSLLKTPNATQSPVGPPASSSTNSAQGRPTAAAPTITTLLTSGAVSNQPVLTLKSSSPAEAVYLLNRPISGPPVDSLLNATAPAQTLLSPSQSAPTLSMLLEKNKVAAPEGEKSLVTSATPQAQVERSKQQMPVVSVDSLTQTSTEAASLGGSLVGAAVEAGPEPEAMAIDDVEAAPEIAANAGGGPENDEDASEEQQLLEVFKNIGDIEDIEELAAVIGVGGEVDFLKDVDDETANDSPASVKTDKDEAPPTKAKVDKEDEKKEEQQTVEEDPAKEEEEMASSESQEEEEVKEEVVTSERESPTPDEEESQESVNGSDCQPLKRKQEPADVKPTTQISSSSEDDDIPLAAVASGKLEAKNKHQNEAKVEEGEEDKATEEDVEKKEDTPEAEEAPFKEPLKQDSKTGTELKDSTEDEAMPFIVLDEDDEEATENEPEEEAKVESAEEAETTVKEGKEGDKTDVASPATKEQEAPPEEDAPPPEAEAVDSDPLAVEVDTAASKDPVDERDAENMAEGEPDIEPIEVEEDDEDNGGGELPPPPVPAASTTADTDYDSSATDASVPTSRRDEGGRSSSRRSNRHKTPVDEDSQNSSINSAATIPITPTSSTQAQQQQQQAAPSGRTVPLHLRRLRDRERSESPLIEPDTDAAAPHQRLRRLRSSTPINDSVPNSPASLSDDVAAERDQRNSKKSLLSIYNALQPQKYATLFQRPEEGTAERARYDRLVLRPMDWPTIKKHIEGGSIRSVTELQRDILLMCTNAMMVFHTNSSDYRAVRAFLVESQSIREFTANPLVVQDGAGGSSKPERDSRRRTPTPAATTTTAKRGGRKSQRNT